MVEQLGHHLYLQSVDSGGEKIEGGSGLNFSALCSDLPSQLTSEMKKNISVPICFVCLLHLANEKVCVCGGGVYVYVGGWVGVGVFVWCVWVGSACVDAYLCECDGVWKYMCGCGGYILSVLVVQYMEFLLSMDCLN